MNSPAQNAEKPKLPPRASRSPIAFLRPLRPGEIDHELIWLCVSIASGAFLAGWLKLDLPRPTCSFHDITGYPCLTCGATRCVLQLLQGHLGAAFRFNPGVFVALCALVLYDAYAFGVVVFRLPRLRLGPVSPQAAKWVRVCALALIVLNWAYVIRVLR